jgi:hypothetical protein
VTGNKPSLELERMDRLRVPAVALAWLLAAGPAAVAQEAPSVVGTWSALQPGQGGMTQMTIGLGSDNTYAIETQLPNGSRMRIWGTYEAKQVSDNTILLSQQITDWRPHQICTQAPGYQPSCGAFQPPPPQPQTLTFESADSFQVEGNQWSRDPEAGLLKQPVDDPLVQYAQAPATPEIPQPVAPSQPGYQTPPDPREQYEQGNQNFLNGYMKGCVLIDGRWQDCQQ